jgi:hypothetical protein
VNATMKASNAILGRRRLLSLHRSPTDPMRNMPPLPSRIPSRSVAPSLSLGANRPPPRQASDRDHCRHGVRQVRRHRPGHDLALRRAIRCPFHQGAYSHVLRGNFNLCDAEGASSSKPHPHRNPQPKPHERSVPAGPDSTYMGLVGRWGRASPTPRSGLVSVPQFPTQFG